MKELIEYYYPKGCPVCGGTIHFTKKTFIYQCEKCNSFASAHRKKTEHSELYEPYQHMATPEVNGLRQSLTELFNYLWQSRVEVKRKSPNKLFEEALINIIYADDIKMIDGIDCQYVKIISANFDNGTCDCLAFDTNEIIENVTYEDLKNVTNRTKALIWLSEQLGISTSECQIGYLTEQQLKYAISICNKSVRDARRKAIESYQS